MDLVVYQMVELQVVHESDRDCTIEVLSGTSVSEADLTVAVDRNAFPFLPVILILDKVVHDLLVKDLAVFLLEFLDGRVDIIISHLECIHDVELVRAVEDGCCDVKSEYLGCE